MYAIRSYYDHLDGAGDLVLGGRFDLGLDDLILVGVDGSGLVDLADRLEGGTHHFAGVRQLAHRRGQGVDHQIHLPQILLDELDHLSYNFV